MTSLAANVDLLALVGQNTNLRRTAMTRGGEFHGPCPFCGGQDRFWVHPNHEPPEWKCRGCGQGGDAIAFVRVRDGVGFREACKILDLDPDAPEASRTVRRGARSLEVTTPPATLWQEKARAFIDYAADALWSQAGAAALAYLREQRHLTDDTIRRYRLGFNPTTRARDASVWGLEGDPRLWLPRGVVLPCIVGDAVWYCKVRRPLPPGRDGKPDSLAGYLGSDGGHEKYSSIRGGQPGLFGADSLGNHEVALFAEGEFDAMLADQEAGDVVSVVTLGSAAPSIPTAWLLSFLTTRRIIVAYDTDAAGVAGAAKLAALSRRVVVTRPPAHDLTEIVTTGGHLRAWILHQLAKLAPSTSAPVCCGRCGRLARRLGTFRVADGRGKFDCLRCGGDPWWAPAPAIEDTDSGGDSNPDEVSA